MPVSALVPAVASVLALASPAAPASEMTLTLRDGTASAVTLDCQPPGGSHPRPARACRALTTAGGDFGNLPRDSGLCPLIWAPVTATATGHWHARPVLYTHTYPNRCVAAVDSGHVFGF